MVNTQKERERERKEREGGGEAYSTQGQYKSTN